MHVKLFLKRIEVMLCKLFQAFPDALFHQLLVAMAHPDHETRFGAHSVFSILLMPSLFSPWSDQDKKTSEAVSETFGASASQKRSKVSPFWVKAKIMLMPWMENCGKKAIQFQMWVKNMILMII
jgi:hypothetical protein